MTNARTSVLVASLGTFAAFAQIGTANLALASIFEDLQTTTSQLQWILNAYTLPIAALLLAAGPLGERVGQRRLFLLGAALLTAGSLTAALAPGIGVLLAGQAMGGLGVAALLPSGLALIAHAHPDPRSRAKAIGIWASTIVSGIAGGLVAAGLVLETAGWRWVFVIVPVLAAAAAALTLLMLPSEPAETRRQPVDVAGQIAGTAGMAGLVFAVVQGQSAGWGSPVIVTAFAVAVAAFAVFVVVELRSPRPMLDVRLFAGRAFSAAALVSLLTMFALLGVAFVLNLYLQQVQDQSPLGTALRFLVLYVPAGVASALASRLTARIGTRVPVVTGMTLAAAGMFVLAQADAATSFTGIWPSLVLIGGGIGLVIAPVTAATVAAVPRERIGMASAAANMFRQLGGTLGIALLGSVLATRSASVVAQGADPVDGFVSGMQLTLTISAAVMLVGAVAGLLLRKPASPPAPVSTPLGGPAGQRVAHDGTVHGTPLTGRAS